MKREPVKLLGRGRPKHTPRTRGLKKLLRASYWRAIMLGELPPELDVDGIAETADLSRRRDVDEVTAEILGKCHPDLRRRGVGEDGVRTIEAARQRKPLTNLDEWAAFAAALRALDGRDE